ncbi:Hypothetical predicted protein [Octopus vulgaris]|uniref:Outer dense fiber protein 3-like protein 2 n=2 Tax=Octopus vulgaris TaxID=6645 RepID=A0AA36EZI3_OCTVU|nr:Hypothetical predicted protein [Octopus vulgaris]
MTWKMTFKPTKPRGPIAAMYSSPGPCYQLPNLIGHEGHDTRSTYQKAPSYVFGLKQESRKSGCSPGPKYNFSHLQVFRDGKDGTPQYSLYGRPKQRPTIHTPGPGSYSISPSAKSVFESAPTYSFGQRHEGRRTDTTPAPNSYSLPALLGRTIQGGKLQAPAYTLLGRKTLGSFHEDLAKSPGPCAYKTCKPATYSKKSPEFSMLSKCSPPEDMHRAPGPGAHHPENSWVHKQAAPCYSFGVRHSPYTVPLVVEVSD